MMSKRMPESLEEAEVTLEELEEFLEADQLEVQADPGFKEELRRSLLELVLSLAPEWKTRRDDDP